MIDHLPECPLLEPCSADIPQHGFCSRQNTICIHCDQNTICIHCERECICDRLRACEQRCDEKRHAEVRAWSELSRDNFDHGFAAGLDAAREAVATMTFDSLQRDQGPVATQRQVLAVIDALRKESND